MTTLRDQLVSITLEWERAFGIAPSITSAISEYDAAKLIGLSEIDFQNAVGNASAVRKGYDFDWKGVRYQVKANRPSGRIGSAVTLTAKPKNYDFDVLIWLLYDKSYMIQEAWRFTVEEYRLRFAQQTYVRPIHMRTGLRIV